MFFAWRDLRFARGRFVLIGAVVALITLLVGFLAGLTGGLASQNVSAVLAMPGSHLVLGDTSSGQVNFSESSMSSRTVRAWTSARGVDNVTPVGITQGRAQAGSEPVAVAFFGMPHAADSTSSLARLAPEKNDEMGLSTAAATQLGVREGDDVTVAGESFTVSTVEGDLWFSHTPAVVLSSQSWARVDKAVGGSGQATVLAVDGDADWDAVAASTHTTAYTHLKSLTALETFRSEVGSLGLMIAMLFGVSALVVGAFFTVWTMQRAGDVAVLKALGASTRALVRDALGQALVVLGAGIGTGLLAVVAFSLLTPASLPFLLSPLTTVLPATVMAVLGLAGATIALRTVTHADPLNALGSNR